jgi:hypothetical protein
VCLASASRADGEVKAVCYRASKCCFDTRHAERMRTRYPAIDSVANSVISILDDPPSSLGLQVLARLKPLSISSTDTGTQSVDARLSRPSTFTYYVSYREQSVRSTNC